MSLVIVKVNNMCTNFEFVCSVFNHNKISKTVIICLHIQCHQNINLKNQWNHFIKQYIVCIFEDNQIVDKIRFLNKVKQFWLFCCYLKNIFGGTWIFYVDTRCKIYI